MSDEAKREAIDLVGEAFYNPLFLKAGAPVEILYVNHRGERAWRRIHGIRLYWGHSEWHPGRRLFLDALDVEKDAARTFDVLSIEDVRKPQ